MPSHGSTDRVSSVQSEEHARALQMAANIAAQILEQAEDGTKLLSVTYNYPKGRAAFGMGLWLGFGICWAFITAAAVAVGIAKVFS